MKLWCSWLAVLALMMAASVASAGVMTSPKKPLSPPAKISVPTNYSLVWSDEFAINGLPDASKWNYDTGLNKEGWHNKELQYYSKERAENAEVRDGKLLITARLESLSKNSDWGGQRYSSARLLTHGKAEWTYGFFEIRARLPCGKGTWPAIWMLGSKGEWPSGGELDILEHAGKEPSRVFSTVHTTAGSGGKGTGAGTDLPDVCATFHNYQMHWTPEKVSFAVDGAVHFEYLNPKTGNAAWPFDSPEFMILNVAVGGWIGGEVDDKVFPVTMEIDYVRVYQKPKQLK